MNAEALAAALRSLYDYPGHIEADGLDNSFDDVAAAILARLETLSDTKLGTHAVAWSLDPDRLTDALLVADDPKMTLGEARRKAACIVDAYERAVPR